MNFAEAGNWLRDELAKWNFGSAAERDEVHADTLSLFWEMEQRCKVCRPKRWMRSVARRKRLEHQSRRQRVPDEQTHAVYEGLTRQGSEKSGAEISLEGSLAWNRMGAERQHAIREIVMFDRTTSEVAEELSRPRSTVKSWVKRGLDRLKKDPFIQKFQPEANR